MFGRSCGRSVVETVLDASGGRPLLAFVAVAWVGRFIADGDCDDIDNEARAISSCSPSPLDEQNFI